MNLLIIAPADRPLTPAQRKFNQLVRKIEQARAELLAWQEMVPAFAQAHAQRARPLLADIAACRRRVVVKLDAMLAAGKWSKTERRTMSELVCDVVADLIENESGDEAELAELKALFDKHADVDFDTENRESIAAMKGLFEAMSGVDLGDEEFESEEAMLQRARERLHADAEAQEAADAPAAARREPRKTAAQRRRESEAQEASQSVREVYRKLVSALHPDRASDEADRATRTAQMKRVNQAYDAKDLLALFALQLEIEQVDAAHLAQATAERARHYNQVLAAQLADLQAEAQARQVAFVMDYGIELGLDPFQRLQPQLLGKLLDRAVAELRGELADANRDLRQLDDPAAAKRWLKRMRREQQAFGGDLF
jgi:hypothetical protein